MARLAWKGGPGRFRPGGMLGKAPGRKRQGAVMAGVRDFLVRAALVVSLLVPVWFATAALGTKFGLIDWRVGLGTMTIGLGPLIMMGAAGLAIVALLLALLVPPRRGALAAFIALAVPAAGLGYGYQVMQTVKDVPPIHDVSTDLVDPPTFSAGVIEARGKTPGGNALDLQTAEIPAAAKARFPKFAGRKVVEVHAAEYGDLKTVISDLAPVDIFQIVLDAANTQGWDVKKVDQASGVIEAQSQSFWFGFIDDIVIRVRPLPDGTGSVVDVRSTSRVGLSDMGMNAKRVRTFLGELNGRLSEAATG